jgi:predicted nuclease of predicted toxin-antitoxin system
VKFLADECCDAGMVEALRGEGNDVCFAVESARGVPDDELLARAFRENRIFISEDKDFGELVYRLRKPCGGFILLRFSVVERELKISRMGWLLKSHAKRLQGSFTVLEADKVRFRVI